MAARPLEIGPAGLHLGEMVAQYREARGWDQTALAERLSEAGRPLSQPIVSRIEGGTRRVDIDDLAVLADVLGVPVAALLPPREEPAAPARPPAPRPGRVPAAEAGPVGAALAEDIEALGDLSGMEPTLAEVAVRLAEQMDGHRPVPCDECGALVQVPADARVLPQLAKELRATVAALVEGRTVDDDDDDGLGDLGAV